MQNVKRQRRDFSIFYTFLAILDFSYSFYNLIRHFLDSEYFSASELCIFVARKTLCLLPLAGFIFVSKKILKIEDSQKRMNIKKCVLIYLASSFVFGILAFVSEPILNKSISLVPRFFFYSYSWFFSLSYIIKYHFYGQFFSLILDVCFWVISILFAMSINEKSDGDQIFIEGTGATSTGYKLGIASIVILCIQTVMNIFLAICIHGTFSGTTGEQAIGAAFAILVLIAIKIITAFILLPAIPLSIAVLVRCNSKKEIEQDRKNRLSGKKINTVCLVVALLELLLVW